MVQAGSINRLEAVRLDQAQAAEKYGRARTSFEAALRDAGFSDDDITALFEAYERLWDPRFGVSADKWKENDAVRRITDAVNRRGVAPAVFSAFTAALKDFRSLEQQAYRLEGQVFAETGREGLQRSEESSRRLLGVRDEVVRIAREMNPDLTVQTAYSLTEAADDHNPASRYDPLRRLVAVSLDPLHLDQGLRGPERRIYGEVWQSVETLLSERERALLRDQVGDPETVAEAFAAWAAPGRKRERNKPFHKAFAGVDRFFQRVSNAAAGYGFRAAEDIYKAARLGDLGRRSEQGIETRALRMPLPQDNQKGHDAMAKAMRGMSDHELVEALRLQEDELERVGNIRRGTLRNLWRNNAAVQAVSAATSALGGDDLRRSNQAELRQFKEMARAGAALRREVNRRRELVIGGVAERLDPGGGPDGGTFDRSRGPELPPSLVSQRSEQIERGLPGGVVRFPGQRGQWDVGRGADGGLELGLTPPGQHRLDIARAATPEAAATFTRTFDEAGGPVSVAAARLVRTANAATRTDDGDIKAIRESGLIDDRLDRMIEDKDVHALVYPLKDGSVVYQASDGAWTAATADEFLAASRNDPALQMAASVVEREGRRPTPGAEARAQRNRSPGLQMDRGQAMSGSARAGEGSVPGAAPAGPPTVAASLNRDRGAPARSGEVLWLIVPPSEEERVVRAGGQLDPIEGRYYVDLADAGAVNRTAEWQSDTAKAGQEAAEREQSVLPQQVRDAMPAEDHNAGTPGQPRVDPISEQSVPTPMSGDPPSRAAAFSLGNDAGKEPRGGEAEARPEARALRLDPGLPHATLRDAVRGLDEDTLRATLLETHRAHEALKQHHLDAAQGRTHPLTLQQKREKLETSTGLRMLKSEVASRGLTVDLTAQGKQRKSEKDLAKAAVKAVTRGTGASL